MAARHDSTAPLPPMVRPAYAPALITPEDARTIRELWLLGASLDEIAHTFDTDRTTVNKALKGTL